MKKTFVFLLAFVIVAGFTASASAVVDCPSPGSAEFGRHIATMTPEHAKLHGAELGHMISDMARGIPHDCF